jgi:hypothetical protein
VAIVIRDRRTIDNIRWICSETGVGMNTLLHRLATAEFERLRDEEKPRTEERLELAKRLLGTSIAPRENTKEGSC